MVTLPAPVFTPPMPLSSCPSANVQQDAVAVGFNFFSKASGSINTDNCTAIIIYNAMLVQCKFASAERLLNDLTLKVLPNFKPEDATSMDLTRAECGALNAPAAPEVSQSEILVPSCTGAIASGNVTPVSDPSTPKPRPVAKRKGKPVVVAAIPGSCNLR